jgi:hypothetical protein
MCTLLRVTGCFERENDDDDVVSLVDASTACGAGRQKFK